MKKIEFFDTILRDGEQQAGINFSIKEKVMIAKQLEKWGITVIEAGFPAASPDSFEAVKAISEAMTTTAVTALARCRKADIDKAVEAISSAKHPQLHVFIATSDIHLKHKLKMTKEDVLATIDEHVRYACEKVKCVEFSPEDATRSDRDFLLQAVQTAVDAGASYINIPDTVGYTTPREFGDIFEYLIANVTSEHEVIFSPHCHDDLGMAVANSLAAIKAGAGRVEGTINGLGERAGNAALEEVATALHIRKDFYGVDIPIIFSETINTSQLVSRLAGVSVPPNKAVVGLNAFAHESGIHQDGVLKNPETYEIISPELVGATGTKLPLGKLSGRHALTEKLKELGISYEEGEMDELFERFKILADKRQLVTDNDIRALVAGRSIKNGAGFKLDNVQFDNIKAGRRAILTFKTDDDFFTKEAIGKGSVDAMFKAIDLAFETQVELGSYHVESVTGRVDAQAQARVTVKNQATGTIFSGKGSDYDVLIASASAYMNAHLRILKEDKQKRDQHDL
ncbi:MAG: 2-isopropylmalate synthase [Defluviitaleaceae bacterium]|nr:2-isopropylmalate synthase [Defluviitaleaceae bacterium]